MLLHTVREVCQRVQAEHKAAQAAVDAQVAWMARTRTEIERIRPQPTMDQP
jgi:hypothetical protein